MVKKLFVLAVVLMVPAAWGATFSGQTLFTGSADFGGTIGVLSASALFGNSDNGTTDNLSIVLTNTAAATVTQNNQELGVLLFDIVGSNGSVLTFALTPLSAALTSGSGFVNAAGACTTAGSCDNASLAANWGYTNAPGSDNPTTAHQAIAGSSWGNTVGNTVNFSGGTTTPDGPAYTIASASTTVGPGNAASNPLIVDSATFHLTFLDSLFTSACPTCTSFHIANIAWLYGTGPGEPVLTPEPAYVGAALSLALVICTMIWRRRKTA